MGQVSLSLLERKLIMARFDLDNYVTVAERINQFWSQNPDGSIVTEMVHISENGKQVVIHAEVYKNIGDARPWATGLAEEHYAERGPNETSWVENGESSAIGRALANAGYATTAEGRPSREEMAKVNRGGEQGVPQHVRDAAKPRSSAPSGDKILVKQDKRWGWVIKAAAEMPEDHKSYSFLSDVAGKGEKFGSLSEKQIGACFKAACEFLGNPKESDLVVPTATVEAAFPGAEYDDAPF
jgi:hypothetical protein